MLEELGEIYKNIYVIVKTIRLWMKKCVEFLAYIIYPQRCPICDKVLDRDVFSFLHQSREAIWICLKCAKQVQTLKEPLCKKCGKPITDMRREYCSDCEKRKHFYETGHALWEHRGEIRQMIYRLKYRDRQDYAQYIGMQMAKEYGNWIKKKKIDVIVPIPLHAQRQKQRGYNQSERIAAVLADQIGVPIEEKMLRRVKYTRPQKELNDLERKKNVEKAFITGANIVKFKKVLLIDDIYTTGSTIDAAAKELKQSGVAEVYFLCASIGIN